MSAFFLLENLSKRKYDDRSLDIYKFKNLMFCKKKYIFKLVTKLGTKYGCNNRNTSTAECNTIVDIIPKARRP